MRLLLLARYAQKSKIGAVFSRISQETLAERIGHYPLARDFLFMNEFGRLGFIPYNGELQVHNSLLRLV